MNSEDANVVKKKYAELETALDAYENLLFTGWAETIKDESEANLHKPLMKKEDGLLKVNFDPKVVALLREVRYMDALAVKPPEIAANIFSKSDIFRKFIFQLDHIASMYNGIRTGVLDVEKPLIEKKINVIDAEVEKALTNINWQSEGIEEYINSVSTTVGNLSSVLQVTKNNVNQIQKIMKNWSASPLIERKDGKRMLNLEEKDTRLRTIFEAITKDGQAVHDLVAQTRQLLEVSDEDASSEKWTNYLEYIDTLVKEGFRNLIKTSLEYLVENTDKEKMKGPEVTPLLEAKLELDNEMVMFTPGMDEGEFRKNSSHRKKRKIASCL